MVMKHSNNSSFMYALSAVLAIMTATGATGCGKAVEDTSDTTGCGNVVEDTSDTIDCGNTVEDTSDTTGVGRSIPGYKIVTEDKDDAVIDGDGDGDDEYDTSYGDIDPDSLVWDTTDLNGAWDYKGETFLFIEELKSFIELEVHEEDLVSEKGDMSTFESFVESSKKMFEDGYGADEYPIEEQDISYGGYAGKQFTINIGDKENSPRLVLYNIDDNTEDNTNIYFRTAIYPEYDLGGADLKFTDIVCAKLDEGKCNVIVVTDSYNIYHAQVRDKLLNLIELNEFYNFEVNGDTLTLVNDEDTDDIIELHRNKECDEIIKYIVLASKAYN